MNWQHKSKLDTVHHIAIVVDDVAATADWYRQTFQCRIEYQDASWALIEFGNMSLALVTQGQHPPHIAFVTDEAIHQGQLTTHRDGTRSVYISDPAGNAVELLEPESVRAAQQDR